MGAKSKRKPSSMTSEEFLRICCSCPEMRVARIVGTLESIATFPAMGSKNKITVQLVHKSFGNTPRGLRRALGNPALRDKNDIVIVSDLDFYCHNGQITAFIGYVNETAYLRNNGG